MDEIHMNMDVNSPEAAAARAVALRLVTATEGGPEVYSREVTLAVRQLFKAPSEAEIARRIAFLLDALRTYAWAAMVAMAHSEELSTAQMVDALERAVDGIIRGDGPPDGEGT